MKVSSILVISVILNIHDKAVFRLIFSLYMKVLSILVMSVIIKLHYKRVFRYIFSLNMKVSGILVISVIIKQQDGINLRITYQQSTFKLHTLFYR